MDHYSKRLIFLITKWAASIFKEGSNPPSILTAITSDNRQFFCDLSALGLHGADKLDFIREVLIVEYCIAFCHSMTVKVEAGGHGVRVFSGEQGEYWGSAIDNISGKIVEKYYGPESKPIHLMQNVFADKELPRRNAELCAILWNSIRSKVIWRNLEGNQLTDSASD